MATMSPSHKMPASNDEEKKREFHSDKERGLFDDVDKERGSPPIWQTTVGKAAVLGALAIIAGLLLVVVLDLGSDEAQSVKVYINSDSGLDPNDDALYADISITQGILADPNGVKGSYVVLYNNEEVTRGTYKFGATRTTTLEVPFDDFYVDNGVYTLRVKAGSKSATDDFKLSRTAHYLNPELVKFDDHFRVGLGLRATDDDRDDRFVPTMGTGTLKFYFVDEGNTTDQQPNATATWLLLEAIDFETDGYDISWTIRSDGTRETGILALPDGYVRMDENGTYVVEATFTNTISQKANANPPEIVGTSNWVWVYKDQ